MADFIRGRIAPYEAPYRWTDQMVRVSPAMAKVPYAAGKRGPLAHYPVAAAAFVAEGRVYYGARWLCKEGSSQAVFLADSGDRQVCARCAERLRPTIYRCYAADGRLLYLGCSGALSGRLNYHQRLASWWAEVDDIKLQPFESAAEAWPAEYRAILAERPIHNRWPRLTAVAA